LWAPGSQEKEPPNNKSEGPFPARGVSRKPASLSVSGQGNLPSGEKLEIYWGDWKGHQNWEKRSRQKTGGKQLLGSRTARLEKNKQTTFFKSKAKMLQNWWENTGENETSCNSVGSGGNPLCGGKSHIKNNKTMKGKEEEGKEDKWYRLFKSATFVLKIPTKPPEWVE